MYRSTNGGRSWKRSRGVPPALRASRRPSTPATQGGLRGDGCRAVPVAETTGAASRTSSCPSGPAPGSRSATPTASSRTSSPTWSCVPRTTSATRRSGACRGRLARRPAQNFNGGPSRRPTGSTFEPTAGPAASSGSTPPSTASPAEPHRPDRAGDRHGSEAEPWLRLRPRSGCRTLQPRQGRGLDVPRRPARARAHPRHADLLNGSTSPPTSAARGRRWRAPRAAAADDGLDPGATQRPRLRAGNPVLVRPVDRARPDAAERQRGADPDGVRPRGDLPEPLRQPLERRQRVPDDRPLQRDGRWLHARARSDACSTSQQVTQQSPPTPTSRREFVTTSSGGVTLVGRQRRRQLHTTGRLHGAFSQKGSGTGAKDGFHTLLPYGVAGASGRRRLRRHAGQRRDADRASGGRPRSSAAMAFSLRSTPRTARSPTTRLPEAGTSTSPPTAASTGPTSIHYLDNPSFYAPMVMDRRTRTTSSSPASQIAETTAGPDTLTPGSGDPLNEWHSSRPRQ